MSDTTFGALWKRLLLYAPECPLPLAQEFVQTAYARALAFYPWSQLKTDGAFRIPLAYDTGTVAVLNGSATVVGSGTAWTAALENRQFYINSEAPFYTVIDVASATSITLDRPFELEDDSAAPYTISTVYIEMPSDFGSWDTVRDLTNNWRLWTNYNQADIDLWDADRSYSQTPWVIATAPPRIPTSGDSVIRYELWPRVLPGPKTYAYRYWKRPPLLSAAADIPITPFRGDVLRKGALAELALWPGTSTVKNPYYNMDQHRLLEQEFQALLQEAWRLDQEVSQTAVTYDVSNVPWAPLDAAFLQTHDFSPWFN